MPHTYNVVNGTAYDADDWGDLFYAVGGHVIAEYLNELAVTTSASNGKVTVGTGAAVCYRGFYTNDAALELSIDSSAGGARIDFIVLYYNAASATIRAAVLKGVEGVPPAFPTISNELRMPLAWVWVPAGFNAATTTVAATNIHDERIFRHLGTFKDPYLASNSLENFMPNSEFLCYSDWVSGTGIPEYWVQVGAITACTGTTAAAGHQVRGKNVYLTSGVGGGIETQVRVPNARYTVQGTIYLTAGSALVTVNGVSYEFFAATGNTSYIIRTTEAAEEITISIVANTAGSQIYIGQVMITQGMTAVNFEQKHEILWFNVPLTDAAWTATAKSTGTTVIDLNVDFNGILSTADNIRGVILSFKGNDSASAANTTYIMVTPTAFAASYDSSILWLTTTPNDKVRGAIAFAPMTDGYGRTFSLDVAASGAGTLDATVEILGIIT